MLREGLSQQLNDSSIPTGSPQTSWACRRARHWPGWPWRCWPSYSASTWSLSIPTSPPLTWWPSWATNMLGEYPQTCLPVPAPGPLPQTTLLPPPSSMIGGVLMGLLFGKTGYYLVLGWCCVSIFVFMVSWGSGWVRLRTQASWTRSGPMGHPSRACQRRKLDQSRIAKLRGMEWPRQPGLRRAS